MLNDITVNVTNTPKTEKWHEQIRFVWVANWYLHFQPPPLRKFTRPLRTRGIAHHQTTLAWIYDAVRGNCQVKKVSTYCLGFVCSPGLGLNWNDPGSHVVMSLSVEICQIETHP